ncbi:MULTISPECIES: hypothetical protein [unclassified Serratia (in: enterobacteria)]|uniref:hypothetical protein n=1 Tax=Serratia TaxID=613 RepID=UPI0021ADA3FD|nr:MULTISPECIES: hypothetical protein [unclassified Serratia (in: enterobacteria)]
MDNTLAYYVNEILNSKEIIRKQLIDHLNQVVSCFLSLTSVKMEDLKAIQNNEVTQFDELRMKNNEIDFNLQFTILAGAEKLYFSVPLTIERINFMDGSIGFLTGLEKFRDPVTAEQASELLKEAFKEVIVKQLNEN